MSELVEVLAANWRTDGRREWASVGAWLQPGESIVVLRAAEKPVDKLQDNPMRFREWELGL